MFTRYDGRLPALDRSGRLRSLHPNSLHAIAVSCAREFSRDYNDQQDLASQALLSALQYRGEIRSPRQFIRTTVRNFAVNHARSIGARELTGSEESGVLEEAYRASQPYCDPALHLILADTIGRMEGSLTPAERRCYLLLRDGLDQRDLPRILNVSRQAVSKTLASIRAKYLAAEQADAIW